MVQIIPNWHPVFVHFTVALLSLAVVFELVVAVMREGNLKQQWQILARWNLWLGSGFSLATALAGWYAYNTVAHDAPSHAAMTEHLYWALTTLAVFVFLSLWSVWRVYKQQKTGILFLLLLLAGGGLLLSTAWHGGELVYRYGLGVMSLPLAADEAGEDGHEHAHVQDEAPMQAELSAAKPPADAAKPVKSPIPRKEIKPHNADGHTH
ncbi:MAG: DUF2231 domain-containing protein [Gallionellaceae bacterium]|jgi:uncharacterized membrane protein